MYITFLLKKWGDYMEKKSTKLPLQAPYKIKEAEKERLNPTFTYLENMEYESLIPGVPYLWVMNEESKVIVGIEKPWLYPQALGFKGDEDIWLNKIKVKLEKSGASTGFGHPSLAPKFNNESGEIITTTESEVAYLGGEINFKNGKWIVDNYSGRFGSVDAKISDHDVQKVMSNVSAEVQKKTSHLVDVHMIRNSSHIKSYYKQWNKGQDLKSSALRLLEDFCKGSSFGSKIKLTFFRQKEDVDCVKHFLKKINTDEVKINEPKDILNYFKDKKIIDRGLIRRLDFIAGQCGLESFSSIKDQPKNDLVFRGK